MMKVNRQVNLFMVGNESVAPLRVFLLFERSALDEDSSDYDLKTLAITLTRYAVITFD
jgi:hypothetical protein